MIMKRSLLALCCLTLFASVFAQTPLKSSQKGGPPPVVRAEGQKSKFPPGLTPPIVPRARLLNFAEITRELKCSPAIVKKIKDEYALPMSPKDKPLPFEQMRTRWLAKEAKIVGFLSATQKQRLLELSYQAIGILSIRSAQASKALSLTAAQDKKLLTMWEKTFKEARAEALKQPRPKIAKDDPKRKEKMDKAMDEHDMIYEKYKQRATREAMTVLTPAQQAKWKAMQGKPFNLTLAMKR